MSNAARGSYVHGVSMNPLQGLTVGECLELAADTNPSQEALVIPYQEVRWTYSELNEKANDWAKGFLAMGLKPGDRLGIWAPNGWEWVVSQFATAKAGLILVNINPAYRLAELEYSLKKVSCRALIAAQFFKSSDYIEMLRTLLPESQTSDPGSLEASLLPDLKWLICLGSTRHDGFLNFGDVPRQADPEHTEAQKALAGLLQFDDPINIQFTSGTTGAPKAATLTHHNIVNNAFLSGEQMKLSPTDRMCIPVPMYHCFGMVLGTLSCVAHSCTMVFASPGFDPHAVLKTVAEERCTVLHGVPTMFIAELDEPDFSSFDLTSLRTGIMAGAPCPVELMKRVMDEMHLDEITIAYGMTETGPVSFQTTVDDTLDRRVTTVGRVLPHTEVKIVDENKHIVPRGQTGELLTRGYCVMPGYWDDPQKTAAAIDEARWIASGDVATIDEAGYCRIVGRIKDMLIRGGENIFPREIEEFLYTHPKIEEVEVIGVPDEKYGEEVCAWIKLRSGENASEQELREFCKDRIAHFKIPRYIRFVEEFPMTVTGKVQKYVMKQRMAEELAMAGNKLGQWCQ